MRKPDDRVSSSAEAHAPHAPRLRFWIRTRSREAESWTRTKSIRKGGKTLRGQGQDGIPAHTQTPAPSV